MSSVYLDKITLIRRISQTGYHPYNCCDIIVNVANEGGGRVCMCVCVCVSVCVRVFSSKKWTKRHRESMAYFKAKEYVFVGRVDKLR